MQSVTKYLKFPESNLLRKTCIQVPLKSTTSIGHHRPSPMNYH